MMSDREGREYDIRCNYWPSGHVGGMKDRAALALSEARAILAVSEPEPRIPQTERSDSWHCRTTLFYVGQCDAGTALASALSAFVADAPVTSIAGRKWL
jgi:hypothetical protein